MHKSLNHIVEYTPLLKFSTFGTCFSRIPRPFLQILRFKENFYFILTFISSYLFVIFVECLHQSDVSPGEGEFN